jgi:hypothetical protein
MDPISIIAAATTAFNALKKGIEIGRELQDMGGQLSQWASAISDLEFLERRVQNPPWYKAFSSSVQAEAIEIFAAKHKAQAMRDELKQYVQFSHGQSAWNELLAIEAKIRVQRQEHEYRKQEIKDNIISGVLLFLSLTSITAMLTLFAWIYVSYGN